MGCCHMWQSDLGRKKNGKVLYIKTESYHKFTVTNEDWAYLPNYLGIGTHPHEALDFYKTKTMYLNPPPLYESLKERSYGKCYGVQT